MDQEKRFAEINEQIKLKLKEGDYTGAERLSNELMHLAETGESLVGTAPANTVPLPQPVMQMDDIPKDKWMNGFAIAHYVVGIFSAISGTLALFGVWLGTTILLDKPGWEGAPAGSYSDPTTIGIAIIVSSIAILLTGWALGFLYCRVGRWLKERRRAGVTTAVCIFNILNFPIGTVLGVGTLIAMNRDDIRAEYK